MENYANPHALANRVRMTRSQFAGSFLIVEGDTDHRVFKTLTDPARCRIVSGGNKDAAIETLCILEADRFAGVLAIVDSDFDRLDGKAPASGNLLYTDHHDVEVMLFASAALDKVLGEFGSTEKIENFEKLCQTDVRGALVEAGKRVGYLRWLSQQQGLDLKFEGISYGGFLDQARLEVDMVRLTKTVKDHSQKPALDELTLARQMGDLSSPMHEGLQICCGHDLTGMLSLGLRKTLGTNNANQVTQEIIEKALRLAFSLPFFSATELFQSIRVWEGRNPAFKVLGG
jgi:hypothetical protein